MPSTYRSPRPRGRVSSTPTASSQADISSDLELLHDLALRLRRLPGVEPRLDRSAMDAQQPPGCTLFDAHAPHTPGQSHDLGRSVACGPARREPDSRGCRRQSQRSLRRRCRHSRDRVQRRGHSYVKRSRSEDEDGPRCRCSSARSERNTLARHHDLHLAAGSRMAASAPGSQVVKVSDSDRSIHGVAKTVAEVFAKQKYSIDYYQREYKWQTSRSPS